MSERVTDWRDRLKDTLRNKIRSRIPRLSAAQLEAETDFRFQRLLKTEVPSDAELRAMQESGIMASDEWLAREYP